MREVSCYIGKIHTYPTLLSFRCNLTKMTLRYQEQKALFHSWVASQLYARWNVCTQKIKLHPLSCFQSVNLRIVSSTMFVPSTRLVTMIVIIFGKRKIRVSKLRFKNQGIKVRAAEWKQSPFYDGSYTWDLFRISRPSSIANWISECIFNGHFFKLSIFEHFEFFTC